MCSRSLTTTRVTAAASSFSVCLKPWHWDGYLVGMLFLRVYANNSILNLRELGESQKGQFEKERSKSKQQRLIWTFRVRFPETLDPTLFIMSFKLHTSGL